MSTKTTTMVMALGTVSEVMKMMAMKACSCVMLVAVVIITVIIMVVVVIRPLRHRSSQDPPLRTSNHQVLSTENSNCPNIWAQPPFYRVKCPSSGLEISPIPILEISTLIPPPQEILYKPCLQVNSRLLLTQAEAAPSWGFPSQ